MWRLTIQFLDFSWATENPKIALVTTQHAFRLAPSVFQMVYAHEMQTLINVCLIKQSAR